MDSAGISQMKKFSAIYRAPGEKAEEEELSSSNPIAEEGTSEPASPTRTERRRTGIFANITLGDTNSFNSYSNTTSNTTSNNDNEDDTFNTDTDSTADFDADDIADEEVLKCVQRSLSLASSLDRTRVGNSDNNSGSIGSPRNFVDSPEYWEDTSASSGDNNNNNNNNSSSSSSAKSSSGGLIANAFAKLNIISKKKPSATTTTTTPPPLFPVNGILSDTSIFVSRPSGMPPKTAEEEAKHQKEIEELVKNYKQKLRREAREQSKKRKAQAIREDFIEKAGEFWTQKVLPNWEEMKDDPRTHKLWRKGLPPKIRSRVWELAIGNDLRISKDLYLILRSKALTQRRNEMLRKTNSAEHDPYDDFEEDGGGIDRVGNGSSSERIPQTARFKREQEEVLNQGRELSREATASQIEIDLSRTFPALQFFQEGGPYHGLLSEVLEAYVKYRPDIGYVQGMSYLAAMLLLYMEPYTAFVCLANMLNGYHFLSFFRMDRKEIDPYLELFDILFHETLPSLSKHFDRLEIRPQFYLIEWFVTLFSKSIPLDTACRLWDVFLLDGEVFLYKASLGILSHFSDKLKKWEFEDCMLFLTHLPSTIDEKKLFQDIESIKISSKRFESAKREALYKVTKREAKGGDNRF